MYKIYLLGMQFEYPIYIDIILSEHYDRHSGAYRIRFDNPQILYKYRVEVMK